MIRKHYPERGYRNMGDLLPGRSQGAIQNRASKLGVKQLADRRNPGGVAGVRS